MIFETINLIMPLLLLFSEPTMTSHLTPSYDLQTPCEVAPYFSDIISFYTSPLCPNPRPFCHPHYGSNTRPTALTTSFLSLYPPTIPRASSCTRSHSLLKSHLLSGGLPCHAIYDFNLASSHLSLSMLCFFSLALIIV